MADYDLQIKQEPFVWLKSGRKDLDVRVGYPKIRRICTWDRIRFLFEGKPIHVKVLAVRSYPSFEQMLESEDHRRIAPDYTKEALLVKLYELFPFDVKQLEVFVIEFRREDDDQPAGEQAV